MTGFWIRFWIPQNFIVKWLGIITLELNLPSLVKHVFIKTFYSTLSIFINHWNRLSVLIDLKSLFWMSCIGSYNFYIWILTEYMRVKVTGCTIKLIRTYYSSISALSTLYRPLKPIPKETNFRAAFSLNLEVTPSKTSIHEPFVKVVNGWTQLSIFKRGSYLICLTGFWIHL